jgi:oligopeptide/dipeptide ABC transporter ATP-binding protein
MSDSVLEIEGLKIEFPGMVRNVQAVRGVDLTLDRGELVGLVGESGSGKSMTALACLGLVPHPGIVTGSVKISGRSVIGRSGQELAHLRGGEAAMIFQNPTKALNPFFTVGRQMVDAIRCHRPFSKPDAEKAAIEGLRSVKMPDPAFAMEKYPHQMSGGQIQRVMIALALACEPKLLIADEPTTALDVTIQAQILVLLRDLAKERGLTILFITHDLGVVATLCDRVSVMYAGRIVETSDVESLYSDPLHPYTQRLLATVPRRGQKLEKLPAIVGQVPNMADPPTGCAFNPRCDKADGICRSVDPVLKPFRSGSSVACHHAVGENQSTGMTSQEIQ